MLQGADQLAEENPGDEFSQNADSAHEACLLVAAEVRAPGLPERRA
ncbi:MAG: hypothetical protein IPL70_19960 [Uliginosibacterium sp.]|nr:hypothetical protein [Uliginosibacterium sp.]